jgi:hypothetical protein
MMTPLEISEYKNRWMASGANWRVSVHSDLADRAKAWCKQHLDKQSWHIVQWTDVYAHTFYFEDQLQSQNFAMELNHRFKGT